MGNSAYTAPPGYSADTWPDDHFVNPVALPSGWTVDTTGSAPDTTSTYTTIGGEAGIELVSDADGKAMISKTFSALTTATTWEARLRWRVANRNTGGTDVPLTIRDGTRRILVYPGTAGLRVEAGACILQNALSDADLVTVTVQRTNTLIWVWQGPTLVHWNLYTAHTSDSSNAGEVRLGNSTTAARTSGVIRFSLLTGAVQSAPPSYTYRGTTNGS